MTEIASLTPARATEIDTLLADAVLPQIQTALRDKTLSSVELTRYYLRRIQHFDLDHLNSVTELNPNALSIAQQMDDERDAGRVRGPLHGTAVLLKDNIGTGDHMHTTAGARALQQAFADRDAFIVQKLREAGVVVLGKTAMTEWANWVSDTMPNGFSAVGGQVRNAYNAAMSVSGSSSGSAVAVAANLATFSLGTETWGSLTSPAVVNGVFTLKPTLGLVSRDRIIPITDAQDTAGPITRHAIDLAVVMQALAAIDPADVRHGLSDAPLPDFGAAMPTSLAGVRIGLVTPDVPESDEAVFHGTLLEALKAAHAHVIEIPMPARLSEEDVQAFFEICYYGFKNGVNQYLADTHAPFKTLDDILVFNQQDAADRIPYGQHYLEASARSTLTAEGYAALVQRIRDTSRQRIENLLATHQVDLLAAMNTSLDSGVNYCGAGYPALALPVGLGREGQPIGLMLVGTAVSDALLIRTAFALEHQLLPMPPPILM